MNAWNVKQLHEALMKDLSQCTTMNELINCKAIGSKEIRNKIQEWQKIRKLTPIEIAIAQSHGYMEQT